MRCNLAQVTKCKAKLNVDGDATRRWNFSAESGQMHCAKNGGQSSIWFIDSYVKSQASQIL